MAHRAAAVLVPAGVRTSGECSSMLSLPIHQKHNVLDMIKHLIAGYDGCVLPFMFKHMRCNEGIAATFVCKSSEASALR